MNIMIPFIYPAVVYIDMAIDITRVLYIDLTYVLYIDMTIDMARIH